MTATDSRMAREGTLPKKTYSSSMVKMIVSRRSAVNMGTLTLPSETRETTT